MPKSRSNTTTNFTSTSVSVVAAETTARLCSCLAPHVVAARAASASDVAASPAQSSATLSSFSPIDSPPPPPSSLCPLPPLLIASRSSSSFSFLVSVLVALLLLQRPFAFLRGERWCGFAAGIWVVALLEGDSSFGGEKSWWAVAVRLLWEWASLGCNGDCEEEYWVV